MRQVLIAPSILSADFASLGDQVREAEAGGADWIHVDVMDGHFVPQISFGEPIVRALRPVTTLPLDVHLMIEPVDPHLEAFASAGADSITIHVEATPDPARTLRTIRDLGVRPGLTLRPGTPAWTLWPYLDLAEIVLVMTVEPGLYFHEDAEGSAARFAGIGIRIEDDVLVTATGVENLTSALPTEAGAVEALVGGR